MISEGYELLSLFMRYVFIGLGILILWQAYRWMRKDSRAYKKQMRALPDAGLVGEIVDLNSGKSQPLPREGMIGSSRACDIRIKSPGVLRRHAMFAFEEGKGLKVTPRRGAVVLMAGVELRSSAHALHGTHLQLGDALLRVRLFAGLKVPQAAQFQMDLTEQETEDAPWDEDAMPAAFSQPFAPAEEYTPVYPPVQQPYGMPYPPYEEEPQEIPAQPQGMPYAENMAYPDQYAENGPMNGPYAPYSQESMQQGMPEMQPMQAYQGEYPPAQEEEGEDEALPYQSPVNRRRRRSRP